MKPKKLKREDILSTMDLKIDIKKSEPACTQCLPIAPLRGHKMLNGIMVHSRIDCPPNTLYMVNAEKFDIAFDNNTHDE